MNKITKASLLKDEVVLKLLAQFQGKWAFMQNDAGLSWQNSIYTFDTPYRFEGLAHPKILRAKFKSLIKRGLCGGCACGCRGDFEITDKGLALIGEMRTVKYNGY